ncbi:MAG: hypothetical protein M0Z60_15035 [Nitrospiraceae bacterium]|nr:hypothetical protein [Nitrospiraceae bacterium]
MLIFIDSVTDAGPGNKFLRDFRPFQRMVSFFGMYNSLSGSPLKIISPGVPDFYQGTEIWSYQPGGPRQPQTGGLRKAEAGAPYRNVFTG